jgi:hypothetical protein
VTPVVVATLFIVATFTFKEPQHRHFNAIMIAGTSAAYLKGGLGTCAVRTKRARQGATPRPEQPRRLAHARLAGPPYRRGTSVFAVHV